MRTGNGLNRWALVGLVAAIWGAPAAAQHGGDVVLVVEEGKIVTHREEEGGGTAPERVFAGEFGEAGFPNVATGPGFDAVPGRFVPGRVVALGFTRAARRWDGAGLCEVPAEAVRFSEQGEMVTTPPADPVDADGVPRVEIGVTGTDGGLHEHGTWALLQPHGAGVYVVEIRVWVTMLSGEPGGAAPSEPFWIVLGQDAEAGRVEEVEEWVRENLASGAGEPCPSGCEADFDNTNGVQVADIFAFLRAWFANSPSADFDQQNGIRVADIFSFLRAWFAGC